MYAHLAPLIFRIYCEMVIFLELGIHAFMHCSFTFLWCSKHLQNDVRIEFRRFDFQNFVKNPKLDEREMRCSDVYNMSWVK